MQKTYTTDTACPNCSQDLYQSLLNHVYSEGGKDFEIECQQCHRVLSIAIEPIPSFTITVNEDESKRLYKERTDFMKSIRSSDPPVNRIA